MKDALGNDIILGNLYGAAYKYNGREIICIGIAVNTSKVNVTLDVKHHKTLSDNYTRLSIGTQKPITGFKVFPVDESKLNVEFFKR